MKQILEEKYVEKEIGMWHKNYNSAKTIDKKPTLADTTGSWGLHNLRCGVIVVKNSEGYTRIMKVHS